MFVVCQISEAFKRCLPYFLPPFQLVTYIQINALRQIRDETKTKIKFGVLVVVRAVLILDTE